MRLVIDASAALDLCLADQGFDVLGSHDLVAPALLTSELLSALRELRWRDEISEELARGALRRLADMPVAILRPDGHIDRTWAVAARLGWAKTYDAEYVALALSLACPLLTRDARLQRGAGHLIEIVGPTDLAS